MNYMGRYVSTDVTLLKLKHTEAIVYCKLKEWLYIAVRDCLNFDGETYFINRTHDKLRKDLNLEFTYDALAKIISKLQKKDLIKIEISENNNRGNKYYFPNQEKLLIEMHASHFHDINLGKVVKMASIDENDTLIDTTPLANSLPPLANSLPPLANSLPLSLYLNNKRNNKSKQPAAAFPLLTAKNYDYVCNKFGYDIENVNAFIELIQLYKKDIQDIPAFLINKTFGKPEFEQLASKLVQIHDKETLRLKQELEALEEKKQRDAILDAQRFEDEKNKLSADELSLRIKQMRGVA